MSINRDTISEAVDTKDTKDTEVIIGDSIYNLKEFSKVHPGGSYILNIFGGKNATIHYFMIHHTHTKLRTNILDKYKLRNIENECDYLVNSDNFIDLKRRVNAVIKYPYATTEWYIKSLIIISSVFYIEYHNIYHGFSIYKSILLGYLMALVGLCIQHDANHGAVSPNGYVNMAWGFTQDFIGGSSLLWKHHHVLLHHAYTNVYNKDPDITTDIIRLHTSIKWYNIYKLQKIYVWPLLSLLPFNWHFKEILDLFYMKHMGEQISSMARYESYIGLMLRFMFLIRFYVIPLYIYPSLHTFLNILLTLTVGGFYLGINFIISHNFEGVKYGTNDKIDKINKIDWAISQIETSSTVGGRILGYFHGGLNYQIEHHLFPRISHVHYHKIKPIVQAWCKDNKIKYNYYNSLFDNIRACYIHLQKYGDEST